jgi:D-alanyl-D-alanine carboxypeptidase
MVAPFFKRILSLGALIFVVLDATAALEAADLAETTVDRSIDGYVRQLESQSEFSGNVLVARNGKVVFERSYGYASVEFHVPNTSATRFRIHSITKQFTAAAITLLAQRKLLQLDDSVLTYLPQLPETWRSITLRELLQHTSGLPLLEGVWVNGFTSSTKVRTQLQNLNVVLSELRKQSPIHTPGTVWQYNNFGYDLLGCVIEAVSHQPYTSFVQNNILAPSGMHDSGFVGQAARPDYQEGYYGPAVVSGMAQGYNGTAGLPSSLQSSWAENYASAGAGDMYATEEDLLRYANALESHIVLTAQSQDLMTDRPYQVNKNVSYGFGWIITRFGQNTIVHHSGGTNGYAAEFALFPQEHTVIVVLSNYGFADPEAIRTKIASFLFGTRYVRGT